MILIRSVRGDEFCSKKIPTCRGQINSAFVSVLRLQAGKQKLSEYASWRAVSVITHLPDYDSNIWQNCFVSVI